MEISSREWVLTLLMIQRLEQKCNALNEMLGQLSLTLRKAGVSDDLLRALNESWDSRWEANVEELGGTRITDTGVFKGMDIDSAFEDVLYEALQRAQSDREQSQ